jgi:hypothetical protein
MSARVHHDRAGDPARQLMQALPFRKALKEGFSGVCPFDVSTSNGYLIPRLRTKRTKRLKHGLQG